MPKSSTLTAVGVDPGLAKMGIAVVERSPERTKLRYMDLLVTKKGSKKQLRNLRIADDDQRRIKELYDATVATLKKYKAHGIGVESYTPHGPMGGGAWKVGNVAQSIVCLGWSLGFRPMLFRPDDLKRTFLGRNKGTKLDVQVALYEHVDGLEKALMRFPETNREHLADAVGHAVLALDEMEEMRRMAGFFRG